MPSILLGLQNNFPDTSVAKSFEIASTCAKLSKLKNTG